MLTITGLLMEVLPEEPNSSNTCSPKSPKTRPQKAAVWGLLWGCYFTIESKSPISVDNNAQPNDVSCPPVPGAPYMPHSVRKYFWSATCIGEVGGEHETDVDAGGSCVSNR